MWSFISGHLGKNPEVKQTGNGAQFVAFSVAENNLVAGNKVTMWVNCTLWGKRAETFLQNFTQGSPVELVGNVTENEYRANDGTMKKSLQAYCWDWRFPPRESQNGQSGQQNFNQPAQQQQQQFNQQQQGAAPQQNFNQPAQQQQQQQQQFTQPQQQQQPAQSVQQGQFAGQPQNQGAYPPAAGNPYS